MYERHYQTWFRKCKHRWLCLFVEILMNKQDFPEFPVFRYPELQPMGNYDNDVLIFCAGHHQKWISWS